MRGKYPTGSSAIPVSSWRSDHPDVEPKASKPPHCYVAMPILPSNSKAKLCENSANIRGERRIARSSLYRRLSESRRDMGLLPR